MHDASVSPPRTIMEVFKMLPEGTLAEVIENALYMSPTPTTQHQRVIVSLLSSIHLHVSRNDLGEVFTAPLDVFLEEHENAVQPDILFIAKENSLIIGDQRAIHGSPDLIIEVLSPGNKKHDQVTKKNLYEKFGVKEYWIVDPETKIATGYILKDGIYKLINEVKSNIPTVLLNEKFPF